MPNTAASNAFFSGVFDFRVEHGNVYCEGISFGTPVKIVMPLADFRISIANAQRMLDAWDAGHGVFPMPGH